MIEVNKIYNCDCRDLMKEMDAGFVDNITCSPPYNSSRVGSSLDKACANIRYDEFDDCRTDEEYISWTIEIFNGYDKAEKKWNCFI